MPLDALQIFREQDRIRQAILGNPGAAKLWSRLTELYGPIDVIPVEGSTSHYNLPIAFTSAAGIEWPMMSRPTLGIAFASSRMLEAVCHEMLHLALPLFGYAKVCTNTFPMLLPGWGTAFLARLNFIEHAVMLPHFTDMGFLKERFLSDNSSTETWDVPDELLTDHALIENPERWNREVIAYFSRTPGADNLAWAQLKGGKWIVLPDELSSP